MPQIHCLHDLIDHLARNGAVIVLSPFNSAELAPDLDVGQIQIVEWPVRQLMMGSPSTTVWTKDDSRKGAEVDDSRVEGAQTARAGTDHTSPRTMRRVPTPS